MTATGKRRKSRELAMQMLFQADVGKHTPDHVRKTFWASREEVDPETRGFSEDIFRVATARHEEIDDAREHLTAVAAGYLHTVALRSDGRVRATGDRTTGACDVDEWENAVALAAGSYHTVAVTGSGRVLATGDNSYGQCDAGAWRDIVAVAAGSAHPLGLRADGTVASAGSNASGQCDTGGWSGLRVPAAS